MRVGLVRNVGLGAVALLALGLAGCDDNPLEFEDGAAFKITTNPSSMILPAGVTALLESRTVDQGDRPTWDDVSATVDAACGHDDLTVVVAADNEPQVIPPGRFDVTGGTTVGQTCINLSSVGGVSATVDVSVVATSLSLVAADDTITFETTTQVTATLLGFNGETLSGFNQAADLVWVADGTAVSVDQAGLVTGSGVGTATVSATWTDAVSGLEVSGTTDPITVLPPPIPVLTGVSPASGVVGDIITLIGTGFTSITTVFVDGVETLFGSTAVSSTEVTFRMSAGAAPGFFQLSAGSASTMDNSNELPFEQLAGPANFTNGPDEPANDNTPGAPAITVPFGTMDGIDAVDIDDFFIVTLTGDVTLNMTLDWNDPAVDVDLYVVDEAFTVFECTDGATGAKPEFSVCSLGSGGHAIWVNWFSGPAAVYSLSVK